MKATDYDIHGISRSIKGGPDYIFEDVAFGAADTPVTSGVPRLVGRVQGALEVELQASGALTVPSGATITVVASAAAEETGTYKVVATVTATAAAAMNLIDGDIICRVAIPTVDGFGADTNYWVNATVATSAAITGNFNLAPVYVAR